MSEETVTPSLRRYIIAAIPLVLFSALVLVFYTQLRSGNNPKEIPSVLIDLAAPAFPQEPLEGLIRDGEQVPVISTSLTNGKVALVNVWASWCVPCRLEHPVIAKLASINKDLVLVGINYKDNTSKALGFLQELGNPYAAVSIDPAGSASIDWGVYGIPETFIVNRNGVIIHKHVGPITQEIVNGQLMAIINAALESQR